MFSGLGPRNMSSPLITKYVVVLSQLPSRSPVRPSHTNLKGQLMHVTANIEILISSSRDT